MKNLPVFGGTAYQKPAQRRGACHWSAVMYRWRCGRRTSQPALRTKRVEKNNRDEISHFPMFHSEIFRFKSIYLTLVLLEIRIRKAPHAMAQHLCSLWSGQCAAALAG